MAKLPTEKNVLPMLLNGNNLAKFVLMFETKSYGESEVPNASHIIMKGYHANLFVGHIRMRGSRELNCWSREYNG